jgi:outer membrane protein OmpA-like peptidoglycan-associated protein
LPHLLRAAAIVALPALVAACTPLTRVVLLPEKDGRSSAVVARQGEREIVLDQPYAAAREPLFGLLGLRGYASDADEVAARFGPALAAQPSRPSRFTVYFVFGKNELTEESQRLLEQSLADITRRPVPDVLIVGHTDSVGSHESNDALAQQRAEVVRAELVRRGVAPANIQTIARGKREPLIPTSDGVAEPRNRRVEIIVR